MLCTTGHFSCCVDDQEKLFFTNLTDVYRFVIGGAGGKGTWGKLGCELELAWVDPNDPNYESDSEANGSGTKVCRNHEYSLIELF